MLLKPLVSVELVVPQPVEVPVVEVPQPLVPKLPVVYEEYGLVELKALEPKLEAEYALYGLLPKLL